MVDLDWDWKPADRCENCKFWDTAAGGVDAVGYGGCRRLPPTNPEKTGVGDAANWVFLGKWPVTEGVDWCGEWQSKPGAKPLPVVRG